MLLSCITLGFYVGQVIFWCYCLFLVEMFSERGDKERPWSLGRLLRRFNVTMITMNRKKITPEPIISITT